MAKKQTAMTLGGLAPAPKKRRADVNLPDEQKGKIIGRAIHKERPEDSSNHLIRGGDDEDPRWGRFHADRLDDKIKATVDNISGEIARRQKYKRKVLGDTDGEAGLHKMEQTWGFEPKKKKKKPVTLGELGGY